MRRLTDKGGQERGAVAVIVAIVTGTLVLTGVAALTIDAGSLYAERRVVQNGADAASLALAQACARGEDANCSGAWPDLGDLANLNSPDLFTDIDGVCGSTIPAVACGAPSAKPLANCITLPSSIPATANWVEVRTKTHSTDAANPSVVRKYFANLDDPSYDGVGVSACARAAWGPIGSYTGAVPITLSLCMFDEMVATMGGISSLPAAPDDVWPGYGPGHASGWPSPSREQVEYTTKYDGTCLNSNGHTANGSFGWLTNNECQTTVTTGGWINGDPGNNAECDLSAYWGRKILVPIFDCVVASGSEPGAPPAGTCDIPTNGGGGNIWYHVSGWASFYLSGYRFPGSGNTRVSTFSGVAPCGPPKSCLGGWLTSLTLSGAPIGSGGTNYGVNTVQVAG